METKQELGQFYTTQQKYILQGFKIPDNITTIVEPFCGNGDLIHFIKNHKKDFNIESYDIDPKKDFITRRDTLTNPPDYKNKYIITNPPYLARNKSSDKTLFDLHNVNDLYKCFIITIIKSKCLGGIMIIPLNFWSSIRKSDIELREQFLKIYKIDRLNIFEEQVFDDTTYTVCSFQFSLKTNNNEEDIIANIFPSKRKITFKLNNKNNYIIGGEIYNLKSDDKFIVSRLTSKNINSKNTNLVIKCIDDNINSKINLSYVDDNNVFVDNTPNLTARTYATIIIQIKEKDKIKKYNINKKQQIKLAKDFNKFLEDNRNKYNSLFLTNYRESKGIARKRISFDLVYLIIKYLLSK